MLIHLWSAIYIYITDHINSQFWLLLFLCQWTHNSCSKQRQVKGFKQRNTVILNQHSYNAALSIRYKRLYNFGWDICFKWTDITNHITYSRFPKWDKVFKRSFTNTLDPIKSVVKLTKSLISVKNARLYSTKQCMLQLVFQFTLMKSCWYTIHYSPRPRALN